MLAVSIIAQLVLLGPFILGGTFGNFLKVVQESVGFFPRVSVNAFNIWHLLLKKDPNTINDTLIFVGLTYKKWGFIMFFGLSAITFLPLIISTLNKILSKNTVANFENLLGRYHSIQQMELKVFLGKILIHTRI
jgi:hypothetical protein